MSPHHGLAMSDHVNAAAALGAWFLWVIGWLPGFVSLLVSVAMLVYYIVQITNSPWWLRRKQRLHRAKLRARRKKS